MNLPSFPQHKGGAANRLSPARNSFGEVAKRRVEQRPHFVSIMTAKGCHQASLPRNPSVSIHLHAAAPAVLRPL